MSDHSTIPDELIIAWLEGSLDESESLKLEKIFREDDEQFMRMVDFHHSLTELEEAEYEVTPNSLIQDAKQRLGLIEKEVRRPSFQFKEFIEKFGYFIIQPRPALAIVASSLIVFFIFTNIYQKSSESAPGKEKPDTGINKILDNLISPQILPSISKTELSAFISNDTLFITQPARIKNKVIIESLAGEVLFEKIFDRVKNEFILPENILSNDIIKIIIYDKDIISYQTIIDLVK